MDWDTGLPADVLAIVGKFGGIEETKSMREVCGSWQEGFELSFTGIKIHSRDILLPFAPEISQRFSSLVKLDIGESSENKEELESDLEILRGLPNLQTLILRPKHWDKWARRPSRRRTLASQLTAAGLRHLRGLPLTSLSLSGCKGLAKEGVDHLRGMPLTHLDLRYCTDLPDGSLEGLRGMPLTSLDLSGCVMLSSAGLEPLRGLPLTCLNLSCCDEEQGDMMWSHIRSQGSGDLFDFMKPDGVPGEQLEFLRGMPLTSLSLRGQSELVDDDSLEVLVGMPLVSLDLGFCEDVTDDGIEHLRGLPLTALNLDDCDELSDEVLEEFGRLQSVWYRTMDGVLVVGAG